MATLSDILGRGERVDAHRPWPRVRADRMLWTEAVQALAEDRLTLSGLWSDRDTIHLALYDPASDDIGVLSLVCEDGCYPSVGRHHPPAQRPERAVRDLFGLEPTGLADARPWLDHARWGVAAPLGAAVAAADDGARYEFLPAEGESLHQIPVGPVHAGIIEPGHFRFTASGETVVRLEERLGYVHKGIDGLMKGATLDRAAQLAGRTSGDSTVAYALAFARAAEAATGAEPPPRAVWLRALMAEIERLANHLGDIGAVCNDAAFTMMLAHCAVLRERVLRAADACFGHRLMRDGIVPGGVSVDLDADGIATVRALVGEIRHRLSPLIELYENTASLKDRTVATGTLTPALARRFGAGGYVGRASGRGFDARRTPGYAPYDSLEFDVIVREQGDVDARVLVRIGEVEQSLALIGQIIDRLPAGPRQVALPRMAGEGMALVEGFRGDVLVWLRLDDDGSIARCHMRDPSWFQWPLLEAVIEGNIVADFPLCNKSFNCSYSGHDL